MKKKYLIPVVLVAAVLLAGCGKTEAAKDGNDAGTVTESVLPEDGQGADVTEEPVATSTPAPTSTPVPTPTPVPANYMERYGYEILGEGTHFYMGTVQEYNREEDTWSPIHETVEGRFHIEQEDNGDGTKTITADVITVPHVFEDFSWSASSMCGFVDIKTGKSFFPSFDNYDQEIYLRRDNENIKMTLRFEYEAPSLTCPYVRFTFTLVCPSDYMDAAFYLTGNGPEDDDFTSRFGNWVLLKLLRNGNSDMVVVGVEKALAEKAPEEEPAQSGGVVPLGPDYFTKNDIEIHGDGDYTYRGTAVLWDEKQIEVLKVETMDQQCRVMIKEEPHKTEVGKKIVTAEIKLTEEYEIDGEEALSSGHFGFADKRTGLTFSPEAPGIAREVTLDRGYETIDLLVGYKIYEPTEEELSLSLETEPYVMLTMTVVCPADFNDTVFYLCGNYKDKEENKLIEEKWVMPEEIPYGDSDIMFFQ